MKNQRALFALALCAGLAVRSVEGREIGWNNEPSQDASIANRTINPVIQWNRNLLVIVRTSGAQSPTVHSTHSFALMHTAIYDAVSIFDRHNNLFLTHLRRPEKGIFEDAAADAAAHEVLLSLYPGFKASLDNEYLQSLAQIPDGEEKNLGVLIGQQVADRLLALRSTDGSTAAPVPYVFGSAPGDYQPTPLNFPAQPQFTHWSHVTPFVLERADQFRPGPPPALTSDIYADAFNQVKSLGVNNNTTANTDPMLIGQFWNGTIQNYWNEIAQTASLARHLSTTESARLFALLNVSLADSTIAFYDAKYSYNFWRPVTAIRAADTDNNPETLADPNWLPEGGKNTAPDPSYPGAHATISAAGAEVLILFFKRDEIDLDVTSEVLPGTVHSFHSFSAAAREASFSRVLAGQHFSFDEDTGSRLGQEVGHFVFRHFLSERDHDNDR